VPVPEGASPTGTAGGVTVGVDVGTTSVKALAVDREGRVVARARVPHQILTPRPDLLEHDARRAWRQGPRRAFGAVTAEVGGPVAGVAVASMVPSLTAVDRRGIPRLPGILYGDARGRWEWAGNAGERPPGAGAPEAASGMPDASGFLRWAVDEAPDAAGYWPCQAVATYALSGVPAIDTATCTAYGELHDHRGWREEALGALKVRVSQMPSVVPMAEAAGTLPGGDTVVAGGTIDALCDQLVCDAAEPGDVLAIFGATLVVWIVTDEWLEVPDLVTVPHTVAGRVLVGGPSNAGALFVDWARSLLRGVARPGPGIPTGDGRQGDPDRVPVWLPYLRGERTPFNNPLLRASVHGLDITQGPAAIERGAYEASGFVIRRMLERAGLPGRRVVASGGGTQVEAWMAGVADATGLPVDAVAVPEGAAYGAAFVARLAAGLEPSMDESRRWARTGRRVAPDPVWAEAAALRYQRFEELGPGS
jgi:xylulokinase